MKKAEMSLQVVVVAVIVLIVLVVLVLVFTGKIKFFGSQTTETSAKYTGKDCMIPGTNNECSYYGGKDDCEARGGSYMEGPFDDCNGPCCYL